MTLWQFFYIMKFIYLQLKHHEFIHVFYNYIIQIANKLFVYKKITNEKSMYMLVSWHLVWQEDIGSKSH